MDSFTNFPWNDAGVLIGGLGILWLVVKFIIKPIIDDNKAARADLMHMQNDYSKSISCLIEQSNKTQMESSNLLSTAIRDAAVVHAKAVEGLSIQIHESQERCDARTTALKELIR